ncbi:hypothetical protein NPA07_05435 [Mycoplasmopsis caviae]|uniref:Lipoprotein n=1 Tax=Mycoplasmopsis caviae TaxID=55603 RepID=A0A3P8MDM2_9BACT|nr:hypothetical protein [Mycoplasmopsis caviae]UUD35215.1 hypothetical protein NPA07_05435 [Mycoplasmopsis caviae]VDR42000.1 Uncharacterised protein [Mycoplasmopsis caviae]
MNKKMLKFTPLLSGALVIPIIISASCNEKEEISSQALELKQKIEEKIKHAKNLIKDLGKEKEKETSKINNALDEISDSVASIKPIRKWWGWLNNRYEIVSGYVEYLEELKGSNNTSQPVIPGNPSTPAANDSHMYEGTLGKPDFGSRSDTYHRMNNFKDCIYYYKDQTFHGPSIVAERRDRIGISLTIFKINGELRSKVYNGYELVNHLNPTIIKNGERKANTYLETTWDGNKFKFIFRLVKIEDGELDLSDETKYEITAAYW